MNIDNLEKGTKLMWDAPMNEFENPDYIRNHPNAYFRREPTQREIVRWEANKGRLIFPVIIGKFRQYGRENGRRVSRLLTVVHHGDTASNFMSGDISFLRYPTEEELKTLRWPEPKSGLSSYTTF